MTTSTPIAATATTALLLATARIRMASASNIGSSRQHKSLVMEDRSPADSGYYCDQDMCSELDQYCCGHNECCTHTTYTIWHVLWFVLFTCLFCVALVVWKYFYMHQLRRIRLKMTERGVGGRGGVNDLNININNGNSSSNHGNKNANSFVKQHLMGNEHFSNNHDHSNLAYQPLSNQDVKFVSEQQLDAANTQFNLVVTTTSKTVVPNATSDTDENI